MNKKQFEIWEKQQRREYSIELSKLQEDFASRGLAISGGRIKAEEDLKAKYDSEIEIKRLGVEEGTKKEHVALKMTESAKNNVFINSPIHGQLELSGQNNKFINSKISVFKQKHPFQFWVGVISFITGLMFLAQYFGFIPTSLNDPEIESRPYLSISRGELVTEGGANEIRMRIENTGNKIAGYTTELAVDKIDTIPNVAIHTLPPNQFIETTLFPITPQSFQEVYHFYYKLRYWSIPKKERGLVYCAEYNFRYEGDPDHPITIIDSDIKCD